RRVRHAYRRYRHGPGAFKVGFAAKGGVPWRHEPSRTAATVHVSGTAAETDAAERAVGRGEMPENPFILVVQQFVAVPTRPTADPHPLYSYAHGPAGWTGDATETIIRRIEHFAPGFRDRIRAVAVRSTTEMSRHNANYVGGDVV